MIWLICMLSVGMLVLGVCALVLKSERSQLRKTIIQNNSYIKHLLDIDFLRSVLDSMNKEPAVDKRTHALVDLDSKIREWESEYGMTCGMVDELRDAVCDCLAISALSYSSAQMVMHHFSLLRTLDDVFTHDPEFCALPESQKARIVRLRCLEKLTGELCDPIEMLPKNQGAFIEIEQIIAERPNVIGDRFEYLRIEQAKRKLLAEKYGITDWKTAQAMNPGIIYD